MTELLKTESHPALEQYAPKILLIDDEPTSLRLVKSMLSRAEYDVITCQSGVDALRILDNQLVECIITDAIMPVMDGFEVVRAIRSSPLLSQIPILMLTRRRQREDVAAAMQAGVTDYVLKPVDEHLLLDKVQLCLKKGDAKRHIFEHTLHGDQGIGTLQLPIRIIAMSESDVTLGLGFEVHDQLPFQLDSRVFNEVGIRAPLLKLIHCVPVERFSTDGYSFEAKYAFVGVPESDLRKIRNWLHRQEIQRRK